jgi:16S rRNA (cytosine1402-N4)-methyltransferase
MVEEVLEGLKVRPGGNWLDATVGLGGHAEKILQRSAPDGRLLGLDQDPAALQLAGRRLARFEGRALLKHGNFSEVARLATGFPPGGPQSVDGILMDLGVSSLQLDDAARGFSFQKDGPLDMRMDPSLNSTAAQWLNQAEEKEIADALYHYGEERESRRVARAIVKARPILGTLKLSEVVSRALGGRRGRRTHPATRVFQALRLLVNQELQALEAALPQALSLLAPGGRLAVISFQSLEDRMVKGFLAREARDCLCPPSLPQCVCGHKAAVKLATRKPLVPGDAETGANPRARSAKLRLAEKLAPPA